MKITDKAFAIGCLGLHVLLYGSKQTFFKVEKDHRAIVLNQWTRSFRDKILSEGIHFKIPIFDRPMIFDLRPQPLYVETIARAREGETVKVGLQVLVHPEPDALHHVQQELGEEYRSEYLHKLVLLSLSRAVLNCYSEELSDGKNEITREIQSELEVWFSRYSVVVDEVSFTSVTVERENIAKLEAEKKKGA